MPAPTHTPASKRFLAPSSSSRPQSQGSSSSRRTGFAATSLSSSKPFIRNTHTRGQGRKDDIETSFEEQLNPNDQHYEDNTQSIGSPYGDAIEELAQPIFRESVGDKEPSAEGIVRRDSPVHEDTQNVDQFSSPLPKRQKRSHSAWNARELSAGPSSPTRNVEKNGRTRVTSEVDDAEQDEIVSFEDEQQPARIKFRYSNPTQYLASETPSRPTFRPISQKISTLDHSSLNTALPDAFTPSRKKGKREYLPGGAAETVRNWVLEIANERGPGIGDSTNPMLVSVSARDRDGRYDVVRDEDNTEWTLIHQQGQGSELSGHKSKIRLKGSGTHWCLRTNNETDLNIAVLWDSL